MKKIAMVLVYLVSFSGISQTQSVIASVDAFFDGFHKRDTLKMKVVCDKDMLLQSIIENDFGSHLENEQLAKFYKTVASVPKYVKYQEKLLDYKVMIDGYMAQVWTPYEFYLNDKVSHTGVNCFTLQLDNNPKNPIWKIVHIIDTRRSKGKS
ncbi:MAG: hypothetical protein QM535_14550 [Limnohabitans sp.]|nr:hypothetical protein [Limnohabitans sp.]